MIVRTILVLILGFMTTLSYANCSAQSTELGAHYRITTMDHKTGKGNTRDFTLWRDGDRVAHQYHTKAMTELWERVSNGTLRTVHYFDHYHRGIEYDPAEVKISHTSNDWQLKYQLVSDNFIKNLKKDSSGGLNCKTFSIYSHTSNTSNVTLEWVDQLNLAKLYIEESPSKSVKWELVEVIEDKAQVQKAFSRRENYKTTDYTDIGDNESDPFLMRMINLGHISHGASGFYDQDGHAIGQGHNH